MHWPILIASLPADHRYIQRTAYAPAKVEAVDEGDALGEARHAQEGVRKVRLLARDRAQQISAGVEAAPVQAA